LKGEIFSILILGKLGIPPPCVDSPQPPSNRFMRWCCPPAIGGDQELRGHGHTLVIGENALAIAPSSFLPLAILSTTTAHIAIM